MSTTDRRSLTEIKQLMAIARGPGLGHEYNRIPIQIRRDLEILLEEIERLSGLINTPETADFLKAVELEAAHQVERWGDDDRERKDDLDWLWLIAYLTGKVRWGKTRRDATKGTRAEAFAYAAQMAAEAIDGVPATHAEDGHEKYQHRIITIAAAALNWHRNRWPGKTP